MEQRLAESHDGELARVVGSHAGPPPSPASEAVLTTCLRSVRARVAEGVDAVDDAVEIDVETHCQTLLGVPIVAPRSDPGVVEDDVDRTELG